MVEAVALGEVVHELQARELLEQAVEVQHPDLVGDAFGEVGGVLGVLLAEEVGGLVGAEAGLEHGAGQHQGDLVQEVVAVRQAVRGLDRPEPQRAPIVPSPASGGGRGWRCGRLR